MAEEQAALRRQIERKRLEITDDLEELQVRLRRTYRAAFDWRDFVRRRPLSAIGLGMALGLLLGVGFGGLVSLAGRAARRLA